MFYYENRLKQKGFRVIIGVDEAGRGPLAGPVVAAAVTFLTKPKFLNRVDDSKKLSAMARERAFFEIQSKGLFGISVVNEQVIDALNILNASRIAMEQAVMRLLSKLNRSQRESLHIIVDGKVPLQTKYSCTCLIGGDGKSASIASASILAKVTRDRIMLLYDKAFSGYGFAKHKGYPTKEHRAALKAKGPSLIHRKSFSCV